MRKWVVITLFVMLGIRVMYGQTMLMPNVPNQSTSDTHVIIVDVSNDVVDVVATTRLDSPIVDEVFATIDSVMSSYGFYNAMWSTHDEDVAMRRAMWIKGGWWHPVEPTAPPKRHSHRVDIHVVYYNKEMSQMTIEMIASMRQTMNYIFGGK